MSKEVSKVLRNTGYWPDINGEASASAGVLTPNDSGENFPVEANGGFVGDEPQPGPSGLQEKGMEFFRLGITGKLVIWALFDKIEVFYHVASIEQVGLIMCKIKYF